MKPQNASNPSRCRRRQHGQAMVELAAGLGLVFVTMFIAITLLAKLGDMRNTVLSGSRYVAWERTVWTDPAGYNTVDSDGWWFRKYGSSATASAKTDANLANEFETRIAMPAHDALTSRATDTAVPALWRDLDGTPLLGTHPRVHISSAPRPTADTALADITARTLGTMPTGNRPIIASLEMPTRNLQRISLELRADTPSPVIERLWPGFDPVVLSDTTALLSNGWAPDGSTGAIAAIGPGRAVPAASPFAIVTPVDITMLQNADSSLQSTLGGLKPGHISPDVVPPEDLK